MKVLQSLLLMLAATPACFAVKPEHEAVLQQLHLPYGFSISIFAEDVPGARQMAVGERGVVFVGTLSGAVYALEDKDGDGVAERRYTIANNLYMPNGVAYKSGALFVAEVNRISRYGEIESSLENPPAAELVFDKLPGDKQHGWKYLRFGPDGKLYSSIGAPCNVCDPEQNSNYASLFRVNTDGSGFELLARGVRNSVGFDWEPRTHHLFFNDNGRDYMGDDLPPDELNQWTGSNIHYGYPYCYGANSPDPEWVGDRKCGSYHAPVWLYKAHVAPLGMRFYTSSQFPEQYYKQLFVAEHGSWNRSQPQGYQVSMIRFSNSEPINEQAFISGWLTPKGEVLGRPVDVIQTASGSLLISDDKLGVIYKVEYKR